jgi:hypothetical protein
MAIYNALVRTRKIVSLEVLACIAVALVTCCSTGSLSKSVTSQASLPDDQPSGIQLENMVVFKDPVVEFIIGPQLKIPSEANPHKWFDDTEVKNGRRHGGEFPTVPPTQILEP